MRRVGAVVALVFAFALASLAGACQPGPIASPSAAPTPASPATPPAAASPTAAAAATPQGSLDRVEGWRADIASIIPGLERIHPDPFHGTPKGEMEAAAAALSEAAATLTNDELMVGVARLAALVSRNGCDGHTGVYIWGTGTYPVESLPLRLWLFDDEVVIVDALEPYRNLIGSSIVVVDGHPIDRVLNAISPLIPRDNRQTVRLLAPRYLLIPQVLRGAGVGSSGPLQIRTSGEKGGRDAEVQVNPIPMADYNDWAGPYGLHLPPPPGRPGVPWRSRVDEDLWWELVDDGETLFIQYNRVEQLDASIAQLREALQDPAVTRVVLDLRHNFGGEVRPLDTMVELLNVDAVDQPGKLFVLTGRNTFSAASMLVARLEAETDAVFVGEPMGGCPTFYGDVEELPLVHTGLSVLVASTLEVGVEPDDRRQTIDLDAEAEITQEDWAAGADPAMDLLLVAAP